MILTSLRARMEASILRASSSTIFSHASHIAVFACLSAVLVQGCGGSSESGVATQQPTSEPPPSEYPNFVVIMTDDQTVESLRVMPKTLQLIGQAGSTFTNSFVTLPWCCPSRATFLTGQYPHNHDIWSIWPPDGGYVKLDHSNALPVWLQDAGYYTSHIGKYLYGYGDEDWREVPPGWSHWQGLVGHSVHRMYSYTINDNGRLVKYGDAPEDYQTDVLADRAEETIAEAERTCLFS